MRYTAITKKNLKETILQIKENTDNGLINIFFGTRNIISVIKNGKEIVLITKNRRAFKKNLYCNLNQENFGVVISGEFKFNLFTKVFFIASLVLLITIMFITIYVNFIGNNNENLIFFGVLLILSMFEIIIYSFRNFIGRKDIRLIKNFLQEILSVQESNPVLRE